MPHCAALHGGPRVVCIMCDLFGMFHMDFLLCEVSVEVSRGVRSKRTRRICSEEEKSGRAPQTGLEGKKLELPRWHGGGSGAVMPYTDFGWPYERESETSIHTN